ncbi:hypothetical protein CI109_102641 [Kwoniella shandongensis]|uniref:Uncharacterized protein n=1 Tax=Kwoniella shandongensis TaxID=1734106 RepID=A0A5M6BUN6_9TREE|nr:uncharacterized protein CI109_005222 [Kwoniella shandongensis]KAA5526453.1 hypothetical protein CI109_005222 [Kwoniella shandongensis]
MCWTCRKFFCSDHKNDPEHLCCTIPYDDDGQRVRDEITKAAEIEIFERTIRGLDAKLIVQQAQSLRPGHTCTFELPTVLQSGPEEYSMFNYHFPLEFDDGIKWLVRARRASWEVPPLEVQLLVDECEVTTMRVLKAAGASVPNAWLPRQIDVHDKKAVHRTSYIFVEFLEGRPLITNAAPLTTGTIIEELASRLINDMARHHQAISRIRIDPQQAGIGSLYQNHEGTPRYKIGPFTVASIMMIPDPPYFFGPFKTNKERYLRRIDMSLHWIMHDSFLLLDPVGKFLSLLEVWDLVEGNEELGKEETEVYIKHGDDKNDQYMLREDGSLVGLIDWEWAYVTTKAEAFCAPVGLYLTPAYINGNDDLSKEEHLLIAAHERLGRPDLADCVRNGRIYHRLDDSLTYFDPYGPKLEAVNAIRRTFLGDKAGMPFQTHDEWKKSALEKYGKNEHVQELIRRYGERFRKKKVEDTVDSSVEHQHQTEEEEDIVDNDRRH